MSAQNIAHLPRHVGIILDGNGRWATKRNLNRTKGHVAGSENVVAITRYASDLGIEALSLYAFSTENWKRSAEEVFALMELLIRFIDEYLEELCANNVKLVLMGSPEKLPLATRSAIRMAISRTKKNTGMVLNIGLNYGGRDEIVRAVQAIANLSLVSEDSISDHLDTALLPPLDLIIRTGGEIRLSNFMIWQAAYAELIFTDTLWPDFSREDFHAALLEYEKRNRRFGGV